MKVEFSSPYMLDYFYKIKSYKWSYWVKDYKRILRLLMLLMLLIHFGVEGEPILSNTSNFLALSNVTACSLDLHFDLATTMKLLLY